MGNVETTAGTDASTVEALAEWALGITADDLPTRALEQAALLLLDSLGCAYAALDVDKASAVVRLVESLGGAPQSTVLGSGQRVSAPSAVLANGCLVRVLDLNDYVVTSGPRGVAIGGHPSDVIPTALAAGELGGSGGRELLAAIVVGYEVYGRAKGLLERGSAWDTVSVIGLTAPVMAGRLLGLEAAELRHAIALSIARGATSATVRTGAMSAAKSIASGLVAQNGVQACLLAAEGLTGPLRVLDQADGLQAVFSQGDPVSSLTAPLPADSYIMQASVKAYPCVLTAQSAVAAALALRRELGWKAGAAHPDRLRRIEVSMADYPTVRLQQDDPDRLVPTSSESADHSFTYLVAIALLDGAVGPEQFEGERWNDPQVRSLMDLVELSVDPAWNREAPGAFPCAIRLEGSDGASHESRVAYPPGFARDGLPADVVVDKFRSVTKRALPEARQQRIIDAVLALDDSASCGDLVSAIANGGSAR